MIDPTKYMPVLQCYTCYNVTTPAFGGVNIQAFGMKRQGDFRKREDEK